MARIKLRGLDLTNPVNRIVVGYAYLASNVRAYLSGTVLLRNLLTNASFTLSAAINVIQRLNDSTGAGPASGYSLVVSSGSTLNSWPGTGSATQVATGMSGNPPSMVPFRPNASVQPWMYIGDSAPDGNVTITTKKAIDNSSTTFDCSGMLKVRSDGLIYKMGIKEPQAAPVVSTSGTTTTGTDALPATTIPWTNVGGVNPSYNYGHTNAADGTSPVIISTPSGAQTLTLTVTGTATVNGASHAPGDTGPTGSTYPANFTGAGPTIVVGAFTDGSGNVLTGTSPVPLLANVGASITLQVPSGAVQFQVGIDSAANTFSSNSGSFSIDWELVTSAIATKLSTLGNVTVYYWGDSPHSGPVAQVIWKNPNDSSSSGTARTSSTAAGSVTNNSWQFDSTPEDGTVPMLWDTLDSSGSTVASIPVFSPALESEGYQDFNMCVCGTLFVPNAGTYALTFVNKDQIMVGIGGGVTSDASSTTGSLGQSESIINALPLVYVSTPNGSGGAVTQTVNITFPASGSYQMEIDYDYWYHTGRKLKVTCNGAVIPPLPSGVRVNVSYACVYRSSITGAPSNPGPASTPQVTPVLDNTVTCPYSDDPQVDKIDYYRQDSGLANYTYVATGPNTDPPTAITDTLSDTAAAANQILQFDNYEPFPSIDLPRSGTCNVSGGVITWVSGDHFDVRWLAGTVIQIGYPTQLAYTLIARPTSTTQMTIPGVPDGTGLDWNIAEPILAAQPLPYLFGPTDNINYMFGVGDPLRPGTLYWCKGSNLDSAPDTNQMDVTDPGEPLVNGAMSGGLGVVFSIRRAWVIVPNFFNATATVTGTTGSTWTLQATSIPRGLFIPRCVCVSGGGNIFFRVDDGIHISPGGRGSQSITDEALYPLFAHEGSTPQAITRNGITIYPPNDTQPEKQKFRYNNGYLYYDYYGTDNNPHTLVFDEAQMGWVWDAYGSGVTCHAGNEGQSIQGVWVGCSDGTVRQMVSGGTETATATLTSPAIGGRAWMHMRELQLEYASNATSTLSFAAADGGNGSYAPASITLPPTSGVPTKMRFTVSGNKWKLLTMTFSWTDPKFALYLDGIALKVKAWGTTQEYQQVNPFAEQGGYGGEGEGYSFTPSI